MRERCRFITAARQHSTGFRSGRAPVTERSARTYGEAVGKQWGKPHEETAETASDVRDSNEWFRLVRCLGLGERLRVVRLPVVRVGTQRPARDEKGRVTKARRDGEKDREGGEGMTGDGRRRRIDDIEPPCAAAEAWARAVWAAAAAAEKRSVVVMTHTGNCESLSGLQCARAR